MSPNETKWFDETADGNELIFNYGGLVKLSMRDRDQRLNLHAMRFSITVLHLSTSVCVSTEEHSVRLLVGKSARVARDSGEWPSILARRQTERQSVLFRHH